jgi:peptidoglycan biosynthesis protein MviN/MurJ (putative lipid II flippase)
MKVGRQLLRPETSLSHSSAIVSVSLLAAALFGAGQALLLALIEGEGSKTDAFLAAYALYVVFAIFGGSLRASVVPLLQLHSSDTGQELERQVADLGSRILGIAIAAFVLMLALSPIVGQALTIGLPSDARWTAVLSLLILSPAAFCQIYAATCPRRLPPHGGLPFPPFCMCWRARSRWAAPPS